MALIETLLKRGELRESDLEADDREEIGEEEVIAQNLGAYHDAVLSPDRDSTVFSAEGTVMHEIRADALFFGLDPFEYIGETLEADGFSFVITEDMVDRLVPGIDWIKERATGLRVEERVDLGEWLPDNYGFCDTFWRRGDTLFVSDYKNGVGEPVAAEGNRQLRLYALGAWAALGKPAIKNVMLMIDQPRAGGIKTWEITFAELAAYGDESRRIYERILRGDVEFVPTTKGCRFCPVRKTKRGCAHYNLWMLHMSGFAGLDPSNPHPKFLDPAQMSRTLRYYIVSHAAEVRAWLAKLHEESLQAAIDGDPDPGSKAILGSSGHRKFRDPVAAQEILVEALGEAAFNKKLIGITEIDKLMKPGKRKLGHPDAYDRLMKLIDPPSEKPKLVAATHPAPAYTASEEDEFEDQADSIEDDFDDMN